MVGNFCLKFISYYFLQKRINICNLFLIYILRNGGVYALFQKKNHQIDKNQFFRIFLHILRGILLKYSCSAPVRKPNFLKE